MCIFLIELLLIEKSITGVRLAAHYNDLRPADQIGLLSFTVVFEALC